MTKEQKRLLIKEICARLPYGLWADSDDYTFLVDNIRIKHTYDASGNITDIDAYVDPGDIDEARSVEEIKPLLRDVGTLTAEEQKEWMAANGPIGKRDYYRAHHFDNCALITQGLAIDVKKHFTNPYEK